MELKRRQGYDWCAKRMKELKTSKRWLKPGSPKTTFAWRRRPVGISIVYKAREFFSLNLVSFRPLKPSQLRWIFYWPWPPDYSFCDELSLCTRPSASHAQRRQIPWLPFYAWAPWHFFSFYQPLKYRYWLFFLSRLSPVHYKLYRPVQLWRAMLCYVYLCS